MSTQLALEMPQPPRSKAVVINSRCSLQREGEQRVVVVAGLAVHHYHGDDAVAEAYAMVFLVDSGFAEQTEVARAFGCSVRTVRRHQRRYEQGGMAALATRSGWRAGRRRVGSRRLLLIEKLKGEGLSNCEIARRLGVTETAVRKLVSPSERDAQVLLPLPVSDAVSVAAPPPPCTGVAATAADDTSVALPQSDVVGNQTVSAAQTEGCQLQEDAEQEPVPMSLDVDPADRTLDRLLACFGLLDDAAPLFGRCTVWSRQACVEGFSAARGLLPAARIGNGVMQGRRARPTLGRCPSRAYGRGRGRAGQIGARRRSWTAALRVTQGSGQTRTRG